MNKITTGTVKIERSNINMVKLAIVATPYNIATFYAEAAEEKIDRDNLRIWIDSPKKIKK